jgi:hypothetical protein
MQHRSAGWIFTWRVQVELTIQCITYKVYYLHGLLALGWDTAAKYTLNIKADHFMHVFLIELSVKRVINGVNANQI